jgi:hypothetical protein
MTRDQVLGSPYFLVGSLPAIGEQVQALRERHGIIYLAIFPVTRPRSLQWSPNWLGPDSAPGHVCWSLAGPF